MDVLREIDDYVVDVVHRASPWLRLPCSEGDDVATGVLPLKERFQGARPRFHRDLDVLALRQQLLLHT